MSPAGSLYGDRSATEVRGILFAAIAVVTERDTDELDDATSLDELGFDSLMFTGLLLEVEDAIDQELPEVVLARVADADFDDVRTVGDLARLLAMDDPAA